MSYEWNENQGVRDITLVEMNKYAEEQAEEARGQLGRDAEDPFSSATLRAQLLEQIMFQNVMERS